MSENTCFGRLKEIYCFFGGYDYVNAQKAAEDFFKDINQSGSTYLPLESVGISDPKCFIGDSTNLLGDITEEASITEIKNPTDFNLINLSHTDANGSKLEEVLGAYEIKEVKQKCVVGGEWKVKCDAADPSKISKQMRIQISWKAPIKKI